MSKLYNKYQELKNTNSNSFYLFKSGMFYIFLESDAQAMSEILGLKITKLNDSVNKCGFPINSLEKYTSILNQNKIQYEIIDNNDIIVSKDKYLNNQNIQYQLEHIKKLDINTLTPLKAFDIIINLQNSLLDNNL